MPVHEQVATKTEDFFFTPEINDFVIVGFTQNDPNRPFVMGSVPHGKAIDTAKTVITT